MEEATITLELAGTGDGYGQRVADQWLWSDVPMAPGGRLTAPLPGGPVRPAGRWRLVFRGAGTVEGRAQQVAAWRNARGDRRIDYADGERFWIAGGGERIVRLPPRGAPAGDRLLERALGAPLALALAARGVHLLHAAAVAAGGDALVAITGASGAGKSTLAAAAAGHPDLGLERVADDILPVRLGAAPAALPHFPQLKLAPAQQYPREAPTPLRLAALVEIDHSAACRRAELTPTSAAGTLLALVRSTVAARLFDAESIRAHFDGCAEASRVLPALRLRYPSGDAGLRQALEALATLARRPQAGPGTGHSGG